MILKPQSPGTREMQGFFLPLEDMCALPGATYLGFCARITLLTTPWPCPLQSTGLRTCSQLLPWDV